MSAGLVILAGFGATIPLRAQRLFEGTITYRVTSGGTPMELLIRTRGKQVRQDMRSPGGDEDATPYQLVNGETGQMVVVMPEAKTYLVSSFKTRRDTPHDRPDTLGNRLIADLTATGRKETILGLPCEVFVRASKPGDEWCITDSLGRIGLFDDERFKANPVAALSTGPFKNGALVLRATMGSDSGRPMAMIATSVDRVAPAASLFKVPAGFTEMKNPMVPKP